MTLLDEVEQQTFDRLQKLEQGRFQDLGDQLLPSMLPVLRGLRPYGLSLEGKTRTGVPDSFVGDTADTCRVAVEYTTLATGLGAKLTKDYDGVREQCNRATTLVLATNRSLDNVDIRPLSAKAQRDAVDLRVIHGPMIAQALCSDRQDLRYVFLNIPIAAHTIESLRGACRHALEKSVRGRYEPSLLDTLVPRASLDRELAKARQQLVLVIAPAGMGKTTWSIGRALDMSAAEPVVWLPAKHLVPQVDPISLAIVHAAFGTPDPGRIVELAALLQRHGLPLTVFLDAVDETSDVSVVERALRGFLASALSPHVHIVLTCREQALSQVDDVLGDLLAPSTASDTRRCLRVRLPPLRDNEAEDLLVRQGLSAANARTIYYGLPPHFRGNPLFLLHAIKLLDGGGVPSNAGEVISAVATYFVNDIHRRMRSDGRTISVSVIREALGTLALACLQDNGDGVHPRQCWKGLLAPFAVEDGENSLIGRATASGVIIVHGDDRCGFSHPLFLEHFAGEELQRQGDDAIRTLASSRSTRSRHVLARLAAATSSPDLLLRRIYESDPIGAAQAANGIAVADEQLRKELVAALGPLLNSRFLFDRESAVRTLSGLPSPEARQAAVGWFNGLSQDDKGRWIRPAADCFLALEVAAAAHVILYHRIFSDPPGMPWYEPEWVRRVAELPEPFNSALAAAARKELGDNPDTSSRCLKFLAMARDTWVVGHLRRQLDRRALTADEHRALVFLASEDAIELFATSCDRYLTELEGITGHDDNSDGQRSRIWHTIVNQTSDISMQEHGELLDLVEGALGSPRRAIAFWALEWAALLRHPRLLEASVNAERRHQFLMAPRVTESVVATLPFARVREIFERTANASLRLEIVHCLSRCPGLDTVEFLISVLTDPRYRFSAAQCLGHLGATRAGPALLKVLPDCNDHDRWMVVRMLGRLRYRSAVPELIHTVRQAATPGHGEQLAVRALGKIGGHDAYTALEEFAQRDEYREKAIEGLCLAPDQDAADVLVRLVEQFPGLRSVFVSRLTSGDLDDVTVSRGLNSTFHNSRVLARLVVAEVDSLLATKASHAGEAVRALESFDTPEVSTLLQAIAAGTDTANDGHPLDRPVAVARSILARRNVEPYVTEAISAQLDQITQKRHLSPWDFRDLRQLSTVRVREMLLKKIRERESLYKSLFQLQWYSTKDDTPMLTTLEQDADAAVANLAHAMLADRSPPWLDDEE